MKYLKFTLFIILVISIGYTASGQVPDGFNFMSIARDGNGDILKNEEIEVKIAIVDMGMTTVWEEEHSVTTNNEGLFKLVIGDPTATPIGGYADSFSDIEWTVTPMYVKTSLSLETDVWLEMGTAELFSVPYAMVSDYSFELANNPVIMDNDTIVLMHSVDVIGNYPVEETEALFEVKRQDGKTMFAVYNQGVQINVPLDYSGTKGVKGGFAIGGFAGTKEDPLIYDLFTLNKDSARIFLDKTPDLGKGAKGGFAIGGFGYSKQDDIQNYMFIGSDSARIYVEDELGGKGTKGGFAIGGFGASKGSSTTNFMDITQENYFIGHETGTRIEEGALYNSVLGYKAARNLTTGKYNTVLGYRADSSLTEGSNNIIIGASAGLKLTTGNHNTLIGYGAGLNHTSQQYNVMIGTTAGYNVTGSFNTFMGINAGYKIKSGTNNTFLGTNAGAMLEEGDGNTIIGIDAGRSGAWDPTTYHTGYITSDNTIIGNRAGYNLNVGSGNIFIGYEAGFSETGIVGSGASNKLYINNSSSDPPLMYGDFSINQLGINTKTLGSTLNVGGDAYVSGNLSAGSITAPVSGNVTGDLTGNVSGNVTGDLTGNVTGDVSGNLTGSVNDVETGKKYLTGTGTVQYTAGGTFVLIWDLDIKGFVIRNDHSDLPCDYWFKVVNKETPEEGSGTVDPGGNQSIITSGIEIDGTGIEVHFGQAHNDGGFCSVWVQYFKDIIAGHYIKY